MRRQQEGTWHTCQRRHTRPRNCPHQVGPTRGSVRKRGACSGTACCRVAEVKALGALSGEDAPSAHTYGQPSWTHGGRKSVSRLPCTGSSRLAKHHCGFPNTNITRVGSWCRWEASAAYPAGFCGVTLALQTRRKLLGPTSLPSRRSQTSPCFKPGAGPPSMLGSQGASSTGLQPQQALPWRTANLRLAEHTLQCYGVGAWQRPGLPRRACQAGTTDSCILLPTCVTCAPQPSRQGARGCELPKSCAVARHRHRRVSTRTNWAGVDRGW